VDSFDHPSSVAHASAYHRDRPKIRLEEGPLAIVGAVFGDFMKRLFNGGVLILAALMFFLVPLGRRTPAQHVRAIFTTPPAREAAAAFAAAARSAAVRAKDEIAQLRDGKQR
jgi:hypothetical protein